MPHPLKTIEFQGGIVSFEIPSNWQEDRDPNGSARFYEEAEDSGTMRLNVLSFELKTDVPLDRVASDVFKGETHEVLASGLPMRHSLAKADENGELLHVYRWDVLVALPTKRWRLVCFGYTTLASQEGDARTTEEFRIIDSAVRNARYSSEAGTVM